MKTYRLAHTNLDVTRIAFGTWHIGGSWDKSPLTGELRDRADRLIHTAIDAGINFIDLADIYTRGKSDILVGEVLSKSPGLRDKIILQAKCGIILSDDPNPGDPARFDFSYDHLMKAINTSLKSLQTDHVEIMLLHRPDPLVEPEEVAKAFDEMHRTGKVRYFGVSNHTPWQIDLLKKNVKQPLIVNQLELNVIHNDMINNGILANMGRAHYSASDGMLDYSRLNDMTIQAWSPVARGDIFNPKPDAPSGVKAAGKLVAELAEKHQTTPEAIALAWLLRHPAKIQPILGTMNPDRITASVKADDVELSRIEWYNLLAAATGKGVP